MRYRSVFRGFLSSFSSNSSTNCDEFTNAKNRDPQSIDRFENVTPQCGAFSDKNRWKNCV